MQRDPAPTQPDNGSPRQAIEADQATHDLNQVEFSICTLSIQAGKVKPVDDLTCDFDVPTRAGHRFGRAALATGELPEVQIPATARFPFRIVDRHFASSYRKIHYLASGGFGRVFSAIDETGRTVALKILTNAEAAPRFRHETNIAAQLGADSDYCIKVHSRGTIHCLDTDQRPVDLPYVDMEFISDTLRSQITRLHEPVTPPSGTGKPLDRLRNLLRQYFIPACHGIAHAHSRGILHRDIKPANIGVTEIAGTQRVRVIDWGLAKVIDDSTEETKIPETSTLLSLRRVARELSMDASIAGTPAYMAPEQAIAAPLTPASDIYALGACLFEILTGSTPFAGKRPLDIIRFWQATLNVLPGQPTTSVNVAETLLNQVAASTSLSAIPLPLKSIACKAMSVDPSRRYTTATELADDVQAWLTDRLPIAQRESLTPFGALSKTYRLWGIRNRISILAGAGVIAAGLLIAYIFYAYMGQRAVTAVSQAVSNASDRAATQDPKSWREAIGSLADVESRLAFYQFAPAARSQIIHNRSLRSGIESRLESYESFLLPAYDAVAGTSNDFSTYYGNDATVKPLKELLDTYIPPFDQKGAAAEFLIALEAKGLPEQEFNDCREIAQDMLWNYALKLPYHPYYGFKNKEDASQLLIYLKNGAEIAGKGSSDPELTVAELHLERRAQKSLGNTTRVAELDALLTAATPETALDYYLAGKYLQTDIRDYVAAASMYKQGIDKEDQRRQEFLDSGNDAKADLARARVYGLRYARAGALMGLENFSEARFEYASCIELAKGFKNQEAGRKAHAMALSADANSLRNEKTATDSLKTIDDLADISQKYEEALLIDSQNPIIYSNYALAFERSDLYVNALNICTRGLSQCENIELLSMNAMLNARLGNVDLALDSLYDALELHRVGEPAVTYDHNNAEGLYKLFTEDSSQINTMSLTNLNTLLKSLSLSIDFITNEDDKQLYIDTIYRGFDFILRKIEKDHYGVNAIETFLDIDYRTIYNFNKSKLKEYDQKLKSMPYNQPYFDY